MVTAPTNIASQIGILFVGLVLLIAGCDIVSKQQAKATYRVTNDLGERLTVAAPGLGRPPGVVTASTQKTTTRFTLRAQVSPPDVADGNERASHVHFNDQYSKLYAGYMIRGDGPGNGFGGGIDIIDVSDPGNPDADPSGSLVNALEVNDVDIQEGTSTNDVLFLGVAEEESFNVGNTPSEVHSIHLDPSNGTPVRNGSGTVDFEDMDLPGRLVKGVTKASTLPDPDGDEFYAITDANTFHQFNVDNSGVIKGVKTDEANSFPGVEFRGLAVNGDGGWAMDDGGNIWRGNPSGGLTRELTFSDPAFFGGSPFRSIARVTTAQSDPSCGGEEVVFAALNKDGFRVIKTSGSGAPAEVFRNKTLEVTSVTGTRNFVYVASGRSIAVFGVDHSTICNTNTDEGLRKVGKEKVRDFGNGHLFDFSGRGQVNEIVTENIGGTDYLFIAKGEDGVLVAQQRSGGYP